MTKYANKIKRKQIAKKVFRSVIKKFNAVTNETDNITTLDKVIWKNIKAGLDYGLDIKYTMLDNADYMPSLENEYKEYFKRSGTEREYDLIFTALTETLLPYYISRYTDLELTTGEDKNGKFFEIKYKD